MSALVHGPNAWIDFDKTLHTGCLASILGRACLWAKTDK